jgi:predicted dehydrogenase
MKPPPPRRSVRYAVVGLGYFAQAAILPAFSRSPRSILAALVSDDPDKLTELGEKYEVATRVTYADYDILLASGEIDAVIIALPNSLHKDFAIRAASAGVHVLCEKPLAVHASEAEEMIRACEEAGVKLMTAYRLHFEEANLSVVDLVRSGKLGEPRFFTSVFSMQVREGNIRLDKELGGGPLWDIGIYCINAARAIFRAEPTEVFAFGGTRDDGRFDEVHEQVSALLRFPGGVLASFVCSFGAKDVSAYEVVGTEGSVRLDPAYEFAAPLSQTLRLGEKEQKKTFRKRDQIAPEIIYFSRCVLEDRDPEPSGWEGLADLRVIDAIYESMKTGRPVKLGPFEKRQRPTMDQEIHVAPHDEPELVHAEQPTQEA